MKQWIIDHLKDNSAVIDFNNGKKNINAYSDIEKALILSAGYYSNPRNIIVICNNAFAAQKLYDHLIPFMNNDDLLYYVIEESLRVEAISASPESSGQRVETLTTLINNKPHLLVTHSLACSKFLPNVNDFKNNCIKVSLNKEYPPLQLVKDLISCGYEKVSHVYAPLTFAYRGSIIDVYPINNKPLRIEYFDDEIESIRFFDVETQKSNKEEINDATLSLASEYYFNEAQILQIHTNVNETINKLEDKEKTLIDSVNDDLLALDNHQFSASLYPYVAYCDNLSTIFDYVSNASVIAYNQHDVLDSLKYYLLENSNYLQELVSNKHLLPKYSIFNTTIKLQEKIEQYFNQFNEENTGIRQIELTSNNLNQNLIIIYNDNSYKYKVLALNNNDIERVVNSLVELEIPYNLILDDTQELIEGLNIIIEDFYQGFAIDKLSLCIYTPSELFMRKSSLYKYANKYKAAERLSDFNDLAVNDYIVHNQYGIGQYIGIVTKQIQGIKKDYLHILYADNGELFVPLEQYHLVRKFSGHQGVAPKLNKLGSDKWSKTQAKLKENLADLATRLVELYADRKKEIGFAYPKDSETQIQFENEFEYPLTNDQQIAVQEIKADMETAYPMDRLLCGDVGFGKTEVAIRCAYKAVESGKQVAILCPTTLLSRQHYITFKDRFKDYPVNIALLNRFISEANQKQIIKDIKDHKIDIIIGTHRLLSNDIVYADLGFLVIDEEHRFGVEQKEKIAELKHNIDVLSLSATPIPRTMQMSLMGVRPCSLLQTPPSNRYPVATYVVEHNDKLIKEIIEKELSRNGQVFYLFNDTVDIYSLARRVSSMVPSAKVGIVHGRLDKDEIDMTMDSFMQNKINVLLCTTVVENGIDIPNANTMIVEDAYKFGLAQLYQIKGRVGRSNRVGFAYFLIPENKQLGEVAAKRLEAIKEFTHLGDGYQIAMRDLMIRGAGDLLGAKQSGFIDTVGIDMIIDVLKQQIQEKKELLDKIDSSGSEIIKVDNNTDENKNEIKANIVVNTTIPNTFTNNNYDKIDIVTKLQNCNSKDELLSLSNELKDQYGKFPSEIDELFIKRRFELALQNSQILRVATRKDGLELVYDEDISNQFNGELLFDTLYRLDKNSVLSYKFNKVNITFKQSNLNNLKHAIQLIENQDTLLKKVNSNARR